MKILIICIPTLDNNLKKLSVGAPLLPSEKTS